MIVTLGLFYTSQGKCCTSSLLLSLAQVLGSNVAAARLCWGWERRTQLSLSILFIWGRAEECPWLVRINLMEDFPFREDLRLQAREIQAVFHSQYIREFYHLTKPLFWLLGLLGHLAASVRGQFLGLWNCLPFTRHLFIEIFTFPPIFLSIYFLVSLGECMRWPVF